MKLVPDWRSAWRWHSTRLAALIAALPMAWVVFPDDLRSYIPAEWMPYIVAVMGLGVIIGRIKDQAE